MIYFTKEYKIAKFIVKYLILSAEKNLKCIKNQTDFNNYVKDLAELMRETLVLKRMLFWLVKNDPNDDRVISKTIINTSFEKNLLDWVGKHAHVQFNNEQVSSLYYFLEKNKFKNNLTK
jgi:hypothetical protein